MEGSRGREWRRRWDPPLSSTTPSTTTINQQQQQQNYPAATVSHQQHYPQHQQEQHSLQYQQQQPYPAATVSYQHHQQQQHFNPNQHQQQNYPASTVSYQQQQQHVKSQQYQQQKYPVATESHQYSYQHQHEQQQNYPVAIATASHQHQQQQHASQQFYKEDYDYDDQDDDDSAGDDDDYDDDDFNDDDEDYNTYGESSMEVQGQGPQTTYNNNKNPVIIRCILIKIGDYKLGLLKKSKKKKEKKNKGKKKGQIKVTISNGSGGSGFIHVQTDTPDFYDIVHKKGLKSSDFRIPLSSVVSFKLYTEHEPRFMGNLTSAFIQVSAEEGNRIRQMFNLTNEHFDPDCNDDVIERKYIKFSTKHRQMRVKRVAQISQIFGDRMEMIGRDTSKFYLNGVKENTFVKRGKKRLENLKNELSFTCSSIHFGKYSYQGENTVFLSDISNAVTISMKHSSGQKMAMVRIPNRKKIIYNLAQYTEDGQNKLMIYSNIRETKFSNTFGQAIGVNLINDFRPASQVDTARMYVVLFIKTNDQNELDQMQDLIIRNFAGKCQEVSGIPIIDEILKVTKHTLR